MLCVTMLQNLLLLSCVNKSTHELACGGPSFPQKLHITAVPQYFKGKNHSANCKLKEKPQLLNDKRGATLIGNTCEIMEFYAWFCLVLVFVFYFLGGLHVD